ncbi:MAG TPA: hypothetical protein VJX67_08150 [Blastocatellia bacterium]|nr:hypothetical protein [Blastocatellia bacterium]
MVGREVKAVSSHRTPRSGDYPPVWVVLERKKPGGFLGGARIESLPGLAIGAPGYCIRPQTQGCNSGTIDAIDHPDSRFGT